AHRRVNASGPRHAAPTEEQRTEVRSVSVAKAATAPVRCRPLCGRDSTPYVLIPGCATRAQAAAPQKEPAMSMIRDLRAAVSPSLRKGGTPYDATRPPEAVTAVVDCAVYRDGRRVQTEQPLTPHEAMLWVRREGGFAWIGLHEPTEAEFSGVASEFG